MKKSMFLLLTFMVLFTMTVNVNAQNIYTNNYGIELNENEIKSIEKLYGKEYVNKITQEEYDTYKDFISSPTKIQSKSVNLFSPLSNVKTLTINKSQNGDQTLIVIIAHWHQSSNILSYDVIGARLDRVTLISTPYTAVSNKNVFEVKSTRTLSNGLGSVVKLNGDTSQEKITQTFLVQGHGVVFASYQHAMRNINLADAEDFNISITGLGSVFNFRNNSLFDNMNGVNITV